MLDAMKALAERSVLERVVLFVNHVLAAEPVATTRLKAHVGRTLRIEFDRWPGYLPAPKPLTFRVTPAGLVESIEEASLLPADLRATVDAAHPVRLLAGMLMGEKPAIAIAGDAAFATDVSWLIDNLRWDAQDDLARFIGDAPAHQLAKFGTAFASAVRDALQSLRGLASGRRDPAGAAGSANPAASADPDPPR